MGALTSALTSTAFGTGLGAAGMVMNAYGSYQYTQQQNAAAEWNAGIMEQQAANYDALAADAIARGESNAAIQQLQARAARAETRTGYAASGVDVNTGSPVDVVADMARWQEYDRQQIVENAAREAWGYSSEAGTLRQQAQMTRSTKQSPWMSAGTSLITGGTSLWNQYSQYR